VEEGVRVAGLGVCADRIVKAYAKLNTHGIPRSLRPLTPP
jgi:hypothetical protein